MASINYMIKGAGILDAKWPGHERLLTPWGESKAFQQNMALIKKESGGCQYLIFKM
jgi:hypothetical protein